MVWLAKKAFFGHVPFPVMHIDTEKKFPEMYAFRDRYVAEWNLNLIADKCPPVEEMDPTLPPAARSAARKTVGLRNAIERYGFNGIIAGIRRDEEAVRAKERVFSPRGESGQWDFRDQPPEFWDYFNTDLPPGTHLRVHPLLHWTEMDIWRYIAREQIPMVELYFARNGKRYRSLGDQDITFPIDSTANTVEEIIAELERTKRAGARGPRHGSRDRRRVRAAARRRLYVRRAMSTERDLMRIVIVGHVDHGKSTLVGRLFHDTGSLPDGKLEQIKAMCERRGMPFEWAFLMDAFQSERDQGITIDTSQIWFKTPKRDYTIIDAPGHREFIKNMITGASSAEAAIMLIDASHGVQQQSRTHAFLLNLLGIRQIVVVVNKMDLVGGDEKTFQAIKAEYVRYLEEIGIVPNFVIPAVARDGDNVVHRSERMGWYDDATLIQALDSFQSQGDLKALPLRLPIQDVYKFDDRRILAGRIASGRLKVGDRILFSPSNKTARVRSIEAWNAALPGEAVPGQSIGITTDEQLFIERGEIASHEDDAPIETNVFHGRLFWLSRKPLVQGESYRLRMQTRDVQVTVERIEAIYDPDALSQRPAVKVERNEIADVVLRSYAMLALDDVEHNARTGRFVLGDGANIVAGGTISMRDYPDQREAGHGRGRPTSRRWRTASPTCSASHATATPAACCGSPACRAPANPPSPWRWSRSCSSAATKPMCWTATMCAAGSIPTSASRRRIAPRTSGAWAKWRRCSPMRGRSW